MPTPSPSRRLDRLLEIHQELRELLTQEERDLYGDPIAHLGDLIIDLITDPRPMPTHPTSTEPQR